MSTLICYDGSTSAREAIRVARRTLSGHTVLLQVWSPPDAVTADAFGVRETDGGPTIEELQQLALERAQQIADEGRALADAIGLEVETKLARNGSTVSRTILDVAEDADSDLIVIGTRGHTAVESALLGSVASAVVHHSHRPVLVVPTANRVSAAATEVDAAGGTIPVLR